MSVKNLEALPAAINTIKGGLVPTILVTFDGDAVYATKGSTRINGEKEGNQYKLELSTGTWVIHIAKSGVDLATKEVSITTISRVILTFQFAPAKLPDATPLSVARGHLSATTVGDYAIFGGGILKDTATSGDSDFVDAYNTSLTHHSPSPLSKARDCLFAASTSNYAIFAGGLLRFSVSYFSADNVTSTVDAYDRSLTLMTVSPLSGARGAGGSASLNNSVLFAGGGNPSPEQNTSPKVERYDDSLTLSTLATLSPARTLISGVSFDNYALFAGGLTGNSGTYGPTYSTTIDIYDTSFTKIGSTAWSGLGRCMIAAAKVENYALFAGGLDGSESKKVTVIDKSFTLSTASDLPKTLYCSAGANTDNYAFFAGGKGHSDILNDVYTFNDSLTLSTQTSLSGISFGLSSTKIGDYVLFGGGFSDKTTPVSTVNVYTEDYI